MKKIINKVKSCKTLNWTELKTYEFNNLKSKDRDTTNLKNSIVNDGFCFPFYIWSEHRYVIDGNGRNIVLSELEEEGYEICDLPYVEIEAETMQEAKKRVMQVSSEHGTITQDSYDSFVFDMNLDSYIDTISFDNIELEPLVVDDYNYSSKNKEVQLNDLGNESNLSFKFSHEVYLETLARLNNAKEKLACNTNEETLLKLLENYE
jgi:hypothetical protein